MRQDRENINTMKMLAVQSITKAGSGHPGIAIDLATTLYTLATRHLVVDPTSPKWIDRDRLVLSAGHGSALLYSFLHLAGFDLSIDDLKSFRKLGSKTPGHPEFGIVPGVDATTGPLGQGLGMGIGMAMTQKRMEAQFGELMSHDTFVIVGDGDLMEGVSHEVSEFAGNNNLNRLIVLYDSNDISLDGPTNRSFKTNVRQRFDSYGFETFLVEDGEDVEEIDQAIIAAKKSDKPSFIEVRTVIGRGTPNEGTNKVHGAPLTWNEIEVLKDNLNWHHQDFEVTDTVRESFKQQIFDRGHQARLAWEERLHNSKQRSELLRSFAPVTVSESQLPHFEIGAKKNGRVFGKDVLNSLSEQIPNLIGGSADLVSSTKTSIDNGGMFDASNPLGRNIPFGVHEFGMGTILNGMALHGGVKVFGSTFAVFSDYMKGAIRLSALQKLPVTFVLTHDSIAVGSDGPTHQPVEQMAGLQSIPNLNVIRPGSPNEIVAAWKTAIESTNKPTVIILSRQDIEELQNDNSAILLQSRGGYVSSFEHGQLSAILMANGTELPLAREAQNQLAMNNIHVRVVSIPNQAEFMDQASSYRESVLPDNQRCRVAIGMGSSLGWANLVGLDGEIIGMDGFGRSGDEADVEDMFDFTVEDVVAEVMKLVRINRKRMAS